MALLDNNEADLLALATEFANAEQASALLTTTDETEVKSSEPKSHENEADSFLTKGELCDLKELYLLSKTTCKCCREWVEEKPFNEIKIKRETAENKFATFAINRRQEPHGGHGGWKTHSLVIYSFRIRSALTKIFEGYPISYSTHYDLVLEPKFTPFIHRWSKLCEVEQEEQDATTRSHLSLLRRTLTSELAEDFRRLESMKTTGVAEFENLELIYFPGDIVIHSGRHSLEAGVLRRMTLRDHGDGLPHYSVEVEIVDWNGKKFGLREETWIISHFKNSRRLSELPVALMRFRPDRDSIQKDLIERGRKFEKLVGQHFMSYSGPASSLVSSWWRGDDKNISERVIVDSDGYYTLENKIPSELAPLSSSRSLTAHEYIWNPLEMEATSESEGAQDDDVANLTEKQCLTTCPTIRGFGLDSKEWYLLQIDCIRSISFTADLLSKLVLDKDEKDLIIGCLNKTLDPPDFDDFVPGKGKGIILLFCGPPGVGKTLAAESIPEHLQRPLYRLGMADLSTSITAVESNLKTALARCARWNATLLIDEADVFLEKRSANDLERNELVSIFLRLLEYYQGIMILTTNRSMIIDSAFESRIDITLNFNKLSEEARHQIWQNFLQQLGSRACLSENDVQKLVRVPLNGRQIKSAIKTALIVYGAGGSPLLLRHFEIIINNRIKAAKLISGED